MTPQDKRKGWIADLKVGDKVFVSLWSGFRSKPNVGLVEKITPTGRITVRVAPSLSVTLSPAGMGLGDQHYRHVLIKWTQELEDDIEREREESHNLGTIRSIRWDKVSAKTIADLLARLEQDGPFPVSR